MAGCWAGVPHPIFVILTVREGESLLETGHIGPVPHYLKERGIFYLG